jgi:F-type H+-transporting ATPase subunit b
VLTAVVRTTGSLVEVQLVAAEEGEAIDPSECEFVETNEEGVEVCGEGPSPVAPELKELLWGGGAFLVLLIIMRLVLFPRLKSGMDARAEHIRASHEQADAARAAAQADVAAYESALASVQAEASQRIEAARQVLEAERAERLAAVNETIAAKRQAAADEARAARAAVQGDIASAASDVAARQLELATGRTPDAGRVRAAVDAALADMSGVRS